MKSFNMEPLSKKLSCLLVLMIISHSFQGFLLISAYPEAERIERIKETGKIASFPFQDHQVFSNKTNCFYTFSSRFGYLDVTITDLQGNIVSSDWIHRDLTTPHYYDDFSCAIDKYGEKIYLAWYSSEGFDYKPENTLFVDYLTIGNSSEELYLLNTHNVQTYADWSSRYVDITVCDNGHQALTVNGWTGSLDTALVTISGSTTSFSSDSPFSVDSIMVITTGINPSDDGKYIAVSPYGENGFSMFYRAWDNPNSKMHTEALLVCKNTTQAAIDSSPYDTENNWNDIHYWQNGRVNNKLAFDLLGTANKHIMVVYDSRTVGTTSNLRYRYHNNTDLHTGIIKSESGLYDFYPYIYTNDRNSWNILYSNENYTNQNYYITKWNKTDNSFNSPNYCFNPINTETNVNTTLDTYNEFSSSSGFCPYIGDEKATIGSFIYEGSVEGGWFYLDEEGEIPNPYNWLKMDTIENNLVDDYGIWILPNEIHTIDINVIENTTNVNITMEDKNHNIKFNYDLDTNITNTEINHKNNGSIKEIAYIYDSSRIDYDNNITISLDIVFNEELVDYYRQLIGYSIDYNNETYIGDSNVRYSLFNLGKTEHIGEGVYEIYSDNDMFSIGAGNNSDYAQFNALYNKLEHMSFKVKFDLDADWNNATGVFENATGGFFEYGMNYVIEDTLLNGWKVRIYPSSVVVGHQNLGADFDYIQWTIEHSWYNRTLDDYQLETTDFLYSNFNGYDNEDSDPSYHINATNTDFWVHLWFSNDNGSRRVATRINSEYFGMYEQGSSWWFGYGAFRPMIGDKTESIYYNNLYDSNGSITQHTNIDIVEFWGRVEKVTGGLHEYKMYNYLMKNKEIAQDKMYGVDTPTLVKTKVLDMPNTGFLSPLIRAIESIKKMIVNSIIYVLGSLGNIVDRLLISIGLPPLISVFYNILVSIYDVFALLYDEFVNIISWMITGITNIIDTIFLAIPRYLFFLGMIVESFLLWYNSIIDLFTGGITGIGDFWNNYKVFDFIQLYLIAIFPFIEVARIENSNDPMHTLIEDIKTFVNLLMGIFNLLLALFNMILNIIEAIIGVF